MFTPRRVYTYAVSAISLNSVAWAIISLLRNLLMTEFDPDATSTAFQIAVIIIGLPIFLVHWIWAQNLANKDEDERGSIVRGFFLYAMQAGFLIPLIHSLFELLATLFSIPLGGTSDFYYPPSGEDIRYYFTPILVLGLLWYYIHRIRRDDTKIIPEVGLSAVIRRLYILCFSGAGLTMTTIAIISLVRWLLFQIRGWTDVDIFDNADPVYEFARLIIGLTVWLIFWKRAEKLFKGPEEEERESALRKFYLYLIIFLSVLSTVTSLTFIMEGLFRRTLNVSSFSHDDIRIPISIIIGTGLVWIYHAFVLREDGKVTKDIPRQEGIRRLYHYLVAGIGLAAFLIGIGGILSVLIRYLNQASIVSDLSSQLTWFISVTLAGFPLWLIPWFQVQSLALLSGSRGKGGRTSVVRKIYIYFFLFFATMTVLSSVVFIVFKFISMILGEEAPTLSELGQPFAYSIIAIGVWIYHGYLLRADQRLLRSDQASHYQDTQVAVVERGDPDLMQSLTERLKKEFPGISISTIPVADAQENVDLEQTKLEILEKFQKATVILGPWMMAAPGLGEGLIDQDMALAIQKSPARKILIPSHSEGWEWAGVERWKTDILARHILRAVRQVLNGEEVKLVKPLGIGAIFAIVIAILIFLSLLSIPLAYLFFY